MSNPATTLAASPARLRLCWRPPAAIGVSKNSLHWSLDVTFREDHSRVRKDHGPQNLAVLRQIALNMLKQETTLKRGIQGKRLKAGWVEDYLLEVLLG